MKEVSVSFLGDYNYQEIIKKLNDSNCDYIHYDVMDGKFVDNKNLSVEKIKTLLDISNKKNDIHLMVKDPSKYIEALSLYDISYITIHKEIKNYDKYIDMIKNYGFKVGLAINPETSVEEIKQDLPKINLVLVMTVHPGRSGQSFLTDESKKIDELKEYIKENKLNVKISVDGGIKEETLPFVVNSDIIVSASYALENLDNINKIKEVGE